MNLEPLVFKKVEIMDAQILSTLAKRIYIPHYPYLWNEGGVNWYVNEYAYPLFKIQEDILDPNNLHFIAYQQEKAIGYLKINIDAKSNGIILKDELELERIYIDINKIQNNFGSIMMNYVIDIARQLNKKKVVLKAMDSAEKALRFYKKQGFEIVGNYNLPGEVFTLMKPEYRGMYILKLTLQKT
jgi:ribosomal protein S18 acetylase RimI-like enzyme